MPNSNSREKPIMATVTIYEGDSDDIYKEKVVDFTNDAGVWGWLKKATIWALSNNKTVQIELKKDDEAT